MVFIGNVDINKFNADKDSNLVFVKFMTAHDCYDLIPTSAKLLILDTDLGVSACIFFKG